MTTTIKDLTAKAADLKLQISELDGRIHEAVEKGERLEKRVAQALETRVNEIGITDFAPFHRVQAELSGVRATEHTLRRERRALQRAYDRIANPLSAGARIAQGMQAIESTGHRLQAAQGAVEHARSTVEKLEGMLIDAREAFAIGQADAAKTLLESVKSGAGSPTVPSVDATHMQAVETALQTAKAELSQAEHELNAIQSLAETHQAELKCAKADAAFLSVLLLESDFKAALTEYRAACEVARVDAQEVSI